MATATLGKRRNSSSSREFEKNLVARCCGGNQEAFRELVEKHQSRIISTVSGIVMNNDLQDIVQEIWVKVWRNIEKFRFDSSLATWIHKIAVNQACGYLRSKKGVRRLVYASDLQESGFKEGAEKYLLSPIDERARTANSLESSDYFDTIAGVLTEEELKLLVLQVVHGFTFQEMAVMLNIKENNLKVKVFKARKKVTRFAARKKLGGIPKPTPVH